MAGTAAEADRVISSEYREASELTLRGSNCCRFARWGRCARSCLWRREARSRGAGETIGKLSRGAIAGPI